VAGRIVLGFWGIQAGSGAGRELRTQQNAAIPFAHGIQCREATAIQ